MKRLALVALAGLVLAGCGKSDIDRAREAVAEKLNDPGSAQFRNERSVKGGWVCGEVNGKNAFGGYIGFKRYTVTWMPDGSNVVALEGENETSVDRINCGIQ
ncbi:hypothetical protein E2H86_08660 [Pseudomonas putida]|uniref:hypothetical protein n=1 Tax=Pseudomonas putida TaxID=303 RepID=UPI001059B458|nr:hypothetical protein [Pseudomonas putida]TDJ77243.1 hypothetical protein E2H86_08660 [Pseudomonas putida]